MGVVSVVVSVIWVTNCTDFMQTMKQAGSFKRLINGVTECRMGMRRAVSVIR